MTVTLRQPLTLAECLQVRLWRNALEPEKWTRTKEPITEAHQTRFYHSHVAPSWWQREHWRPEHQFYAVEIFGHFVGFTGLTYLRKVSGEAEISLVLNPSFARQGIGTATVTALLQEARRRRLHAVIGECYKEGAQEFWTKQVVARPPIDMSIDDAGTLRWRWTL